MQYFFQLLKFLALTSLQNKPTEQSISVVTDVSIEKFFLSVADNKYKQLIDKYKQNSSSIQSFIIIIIT